MTYGMHTGFGIDEARRTPQAQVTHDEIDKLSILNVLPNAAEYSAGGRA